MMLRAGGTEPRFDEFRICMNTDQSLCRINTWIVRYQSTREFRIRFSLCLVIFSARAVRDWFPW